MSNISYNQFSRFTDSAERDLMSNALSNGEAVSINAVFKSIWNAVKKGFRVASEYMVDLTEALDEARAKDSRFSRSQW
jgi:hypothetical protein